MRKEEKSQRTGVSTFASRTSPSTDQSLQKSFHLSHAGQNFKIFSPQNEKLKHPTRNPTMDANSTKTMVYRHSEQERQHTTTAHSTCATASGQFVALCVFRLTPSVSHRATIILTADVTRCHSGNRWQ